MILQKLINLRRTIILKPLNYLIFLIFLILLFKNKFEIKVKNLPLYSSSSSSSSTLLAGDSSNTKCTLDELSQGKWIKKVVVTSSSNTPRKVSDFLLGTERINMLECEGTEERILEINDYIFESSFSSKCNRLEWDQFKVIRRLLTMPEGLIIVGDSLGEQFSATFRSLLSLNVLIEGSQILGSILLNGNKINLHKILTLNLKNSLVKSQFLSTTSTTSNNNNKEFSKNRLEKPLIQFFRSHHLLSDEDLTRILTPSTTTSPPPSTPPLDVDLPTKPLQVVDEEQQVLVKRIGYPWGSDPDFITFLHKVLLSYRVLPSDYEIGYLENSNPTVVILNSGPHWHTSRFTTIPITSSSSSSSQKELEGSLDTELLTEESEEEEFNPILIGYRKMVQQILTTLPDSSNLHTIIRNSNPVSSTCSSIPSPPSLTPTTIIEEISTGGRYNYDLFTKFDQIWKEALVQNVGVYRGNGIKRRGKVEIWNDWNMMSKRMEAKKGPSKGDCLHFCIMALYESARILLQVLIDT